MPHSATLRVSEGQGAPFSPFPPVLSVGDFQYNMVLHDFIIMFGEHILIRLRSLLGQVSMTPIDERRCVRHV